MESCYQGAGLAITHCALCASKGLTACECQALGENSPPVDSEFQLSGDSLYRVNDAVVLD
jgi:hypothetical protein